MYLEHQVQRQNDSSIIYGKLLQNYGKNQYVCIVACLT